MQFSYFTTIAVTVMCCVLNPQKPSYKILSLKKTEQYLSNMVCAFEAPAKFDTSGWLPAKKKERKIDK